MDGFTTISTMLHAAAFYFIVQLLREKKNFQKQQHQMASEIEDALTLFTIEMQAENDKILKKIEGLYEQDRAVQTKENTTMKETEPALGDDQDQERNTLSSEQKKIIQLANNGLSSTEIAKEMNKGKGEIDLLLKFYR